MNPLVQGFLLGLANGASCLATCAPVLLPYLIGEGGAVGRNAVTVLHFLAGRLAGYLIFAAVAWEAGRWIRVSQHSSLIFGAIYAALALVLVFYGFSSPARVCAMGGGRGRLAGLTSRRPSAMPAVIGLLTGLSLCPPFLAAIAGATGEATLLASVMFFLAFFVATSVYLVPFPLAGLLGRSQAIRITGRLAAGVMGVYFMYKGLVMMFGGLRS
jgi:hypothetical protein